MKKILFDVTDEMFQKMDKVVLKGDFLSRSEFLRFLVTTYFKENGIGDTSQVAIRKKEGPKNVFEEPKSLLDEFPGASLEFGIPEEIIARLKEKCGIK